jgi:AcrR family transcriptional regulator
VNRLEAEIGLSRGAIFNYFPSKWDIFLALAERDNARGAEIWLEHGFAALVEHLVEQEPEWLGVYLEHARRLRTDPRLRERWENRNPDLERRLKARIEELQASGEFRKDLTADQIGNFLGVVLDGVAVRASFGMGEDVQLLLRLVHDAMAPRA